VYHRALAVQLGADPSGGALSEAGRVEDHYCLFHRRVLPDRYPVQPRPGMAVLGPLIVAERPGERLLCNQLHTGPHLWPNGDEVEAESPSPST
jgi:hypothetical protein